MSHLDILNERMIPDLIEMLERKEIRQIPPGVDSTELANSTVGCGNFVQYPPLYPQYLFEDVFANPIAGAVLCNVLGPKPELRHVFTNSVFPIKRIELKRGLGWEDPPTCSLRHGSRTLGLSFCDDREYSVR